MVVLLSVYASLPLVCWALWKVFRNYFVKSPFDNIPGPGRASFWKGNTHQLYARHGWDFHHSISQVYGQVVKFHAPLGRRGLYVFDPKALNHVIVKDLMIYEEPHWFLETNILSFGPSIFSTAGEHHRKQRKLLNPVFSINHMRHLAPVFYAVAHRLRDGLSMQISESDGDIDILDWMGRTALELVGQGGLGYSFDTLVDATPNAYRDALKEFLPTNYTLHFWRMLYPYTAHFVPASVRRLVAPWLPHPAMQKMRRILETMDGQAKSIYYTKKAALEKDDRSIELQVNEGRDILSVLMKANREALEGDRLPEEEVIAQISSLVFAATDTTSNALARILQLLAEHQDVQNRIREELFEAAPDGEDIPYNRLVDLLYMDAVCRETLRLYPPVTFMSREARQDAVLPLLEPIKGVDGAFIDEIVVPKDTPVLIGIRACNRNKALWGEDALEWKPERWLAPLPEALVDAHVPGIYSNLMTFLGGGRACLGFKFSQLEMKVILATLLRSFRLSSGSTDVYWNLAGVSYPTTGKDSAKAAMYLKLEPIKAY